MLVRRAILLMALSLAAAVGSTPARAEPEHVHIQYSATKGCPDRAAFLRALHQRTERFELARNGEPARSFVVTIGQTDALVSGRLAITSPGAPPSLRSITGKTCDEVMAVLAFMTGLAIDPSASPNPKASPSPTASPPSPSQPGPAPPRPPAATAPPAAATSRLAKNPTPETATAPAGAAPANTTSRAPRAPTPEVAEPAAPAAARPTPPPSERRESVPREPEAAPPALTVKRPPPSQGSSASSESWAWAAGLHGGTSLGLAPNPGLGGLLFVEAAAPGPGVLGPVLRLGLFLHQSDARLADGATARLRWAAFMIEGCPLRLAAVDARLALHACVASHVGVLRGRSQQLEQPAHTTDAWADLGPVARVRLAVGAGIFVEVQGMLVLPLRRLTYDVYYDGPTRQPTSVFTVARLGALAGIGVAYRFR